MAKRFQLYYCLKGMIGMRTVTKIASWIGATPFALYTVGFGALLFSIAYFGRRSGIIKVIALNLGVLVGGVAVCDLGYGWYQKIFTVKGDSEATGTYGTSPYFTPYPSRGYGMAKNASVTSKLVSKGTVVYDAVYSSDAMGLRKVPKHFPLDFQKANALLFFGCSFTFGEGISDDETLPALTQKVSNGRLETKNFAFHGYGPHQLLSIIENREDQSLSRLRAGEKVVGGVFQTITGHVDRAMGFSSWEDEGPYYVLDAAENLHKKELKYSRSLFRRLKYMPLIFSSSMLREIALTFDRFQVRVGMKAGEKLTAKIVKKAQDLFVERHKAPFLVIVWPSGVGEGNSPRFQRYAATLKDAGINALRIDEVIPDYFQKNTEYHLPIDGHPGPKINLLIAKYLEKRFDILK